MRALAAILGAAALFTLATWFVPWWIVPVVAAALSLAAPAVFTPTRVAAGAAVSWAALLVWAAATAPVARLARALGETVHAPWPLLLVISPLFAALLAWSAATLVRRRGAAEPALRPDS